MEGVRFYPPYFPLGLIEEQSQSSPTIGFIGSRVSELLMSLIHQKLKLI